MRSELIVDIPAVRAWATALRKTADHVTVDPSPPVAGPAWSCTAADGEATAAARRVLAALAEDIDGLGLAVLATADDYEAADDRAARMLRRFR